MDRVGTLALVLAALGCGTYSPELETCAITCDPENGIACPRNLSCGTDFHCHETADDTVCTFDITIVLDNADAFPDAEIVGPGPARCPSETCTFQLAGGVRTRFVRDPLSSDFVSFSGGCEGRISCDIVPHEDTEVHVIFGAGRTIEVTYLGDGVGSVTSDPGTIDCHGFALGRCLETFSTSESVDLRAKPTFPSVFLGWTGASCGADLMCTIPPGSDPIAVASTLEVTRLFIAAVGVTGIDDTITPIIDAELKQPCKTNASCEELLAPGGSHAVQLTPTTTSDRKFKEWIGPTCAALLPNDPPDSCTFTVTDDLVVIGVFEPQPAPI
jgi:hypothetical protein